MSIIGVKVNDGFTTRVDSVPDKLLDRLVSVTNRAPNTYMAIEPDGKMTFIFHYKAIVISKS
ncbi:hypothetical protein ACTXT7_017105 [Hymenolepis weldensis]